MMTDTVGCNQCGYPRTGVVMSTTENRNGLRYQRRKRKCHRCGASYHTVEIMETNHHAIERRKRSERTDSETTRLRQGHG